MPFLPTRGLHVSADGPNTIHYGPLTWPNHQKYQYFTVEVVYSLKMNIFNIVKFKKWVLDDFRGPELIEFWVWGLNPNNFLPRTPWNWEMVIFPFLGHLFWPQLDFSEKLETRRKIQLFVNNELRLRSQNMAIMNVF